ncbi:MAG: hypothetical protein KDI65_08725 [Alphaproteobacteria bacterium]|nr:hypothetical protein [Alphaproteobacteria bacterium]
MTPAPNKPAILFILALAAAAFFWTGMTVWRQQELAFLASNPDTIFFQDASQKTEKPCPADALAFFVIGQSHAANSMLPRTSAEDNPALLNYFNGKCYLLSDPVLGPSDRHGSLWPLFARKLYAHVEKPVVVMSYAAGGTTAQQWLPGEVNLGLMKRAVEDAQRYIAQGGTLQYVIFDQGQMDAMLDTPAPTYRARLKTIFDYVQEQLPGKQTFFMYGQSWCTRYNPPVPHIVQAQKEFAASHPDTVMVFNMDTLDDSYRHDNCHFNEKGREVVAKKLVNAVLRTMEED